MKKEKIILSLAAVIFGLLAAGGAFYFFQTAKTVSQGNSKTISFVSPSPTPVPAVSLSIDEPKNEDVVSGQEIVVSGVTRPDAVVDVVTDSSDQVVTPSPDGKFSATIDLSNGENAIEVIAFAPDGQSISVKRTVTYSTENF